MKFCETHLSVHLQEVVAVKVSGAAFQQMYSGRSLENHALFISFRKRKPAIGDM